MVSMPDTTGNADALAHLMGSEELLPAMLEEPEAVARALQKIETVYERTMREVYDIVRGVNEGGSCVDWLSTWAPGFHAQNADSAGARCMGYRSKCSALLFCLYLG